MENKLKFPAATVSAAKLRRAAEAAHGLRDEEVRLVLRDGELIVLKPEEKSVDADEGVLKLWTEDRVKRRVDFTLTLKVGDRPDVPLRRRFDAIFWSESAIDKFMLSYYVRINTPTQLNEILKAFDIPDIVALAHGPTTEYEPMEDAPPPDDPYAGLFAIRVPQRTEGMPEIVPLWKVINRPAPASEA